MANNTRISQPV